MKKLFKNTKINQSKKLFLISLMLIASFGAFAQITVNSSGYVGLNTTIQSGFYVSMSDKVIFYHGAYPSLKIDNSATNCYYGLALYPSSNNSCNLGKSDKVFSHIYGAQGVVETSDARKKENIREIKEALKLVMQLLPVEYDWKKEFAYNDTLVTTLKEKEKLEKERKNKIGFLAQDVEKVIPEVVVYDDSTDSYGIIYTQLIPVLTQAIKEQQVTIEELQVSNSELLARIEKLEGNTAKEKSATLDETTPASLNQNIPNPFNANTTINMYLPNTVTKAVLYIYSMQGEQIQKLIINERGNTAATIEGHSLKAGMYLYTLVADGQEVDTHKMILTK